ncbi:MAG: ATP-binding protein [Pseudomonadota bacterium]
MQRRTRLIQHFVAILTLCATLMVGGLSLFRAIGTIGSPFAGFFFGPNLLVGIGQRAEWPGIQAGLRSLDKITAVDGVPISTGVELLERVGKNRPGETFTYRIERRGVVQEIGAPITRYTLNDFLIVCLAPFLMGLLFVTFGGILYFTQPSARGSLTYLFLCCLIGIFCMAVYEAYTSFAFFRVILLYPLIGALLVHLFALFPESPSVRTRVRVAVTGVYLVAFALVAAREIFFKDSVISALLSRLSSTYVLIVLSTSLYLLVRAYFRAKSQAARDKIKVIGIGLVLASSFVAAWSLNFVLLAKSFALDEGVLLGSFFPVFMTYAVLRKNVFELDRVIRLSLSYGVAAAVVLVLYLAVIGGVRELIGPGDAFGRSFSWFFVVLAGVGALLFNRLRRGVNDLVRRLLFRSRFDLGTALTELDRSLVAGLPAAQLAEQVTERLVELLKLQRTAVLCPSMHIASRAVVRAARWNDPPAMEKWLPLFEGEGVLDRLQEKPTPVKVGTLGEERPERYRQSVATLQSNGIEVLVPCISSGKLFGVLLLGAKESRDRWEADELLLLEPIGVRMGIVLENAELAVAADRQARLAAVGQMASVLIHDIKNPLSTIRISAGTIKRRFREGDHAYELVTFVEEEVDRMDRTIQGILTYAKPMGLSLRDCSMNTLVAKVVERVAPSFEKNEVRLVFMRSEKEPVFQGDETLLGRAVENLLVNAMEATPRGGTVTVRVGFEGNGRDRLAVIVEDTGRGMDATIREQVFKPFFTTKSTGTGLGLAIVKQIVSEHGGEIELESRPGSGTRFTLEFPAGGSA